MCIYVGGLCLAWLWDERGGEQLIGGLIRLHQIVLGTVVRVRAVMPWLGLLDSHLHWIIRGLNVSLKRPIGLSAFGVLSCSTSA